MDAFQCIPDARQLLRKSDIANDLRCIGCRTVEFDLALARRTVREPLAGAARLPPDAAFMGGNVDREGQFVALAQAVDAIMARQVRRRRVGSRGHLGPALFLRGRSASRGKRRPKQESDEDCDRFHGLDLRLSI